MIHGKLWSFDQLRETGLLWLINSTVFHPRGYALALHYPQSNETGVEGEPDGFYILGDGHDPWMYDMHNDGLELDKLMLRAAALLRPDFRNAVGDPFHGDWDDSGPE